MQAATLTRSRPYTNPSSVEVTSYIDHGEAQHLFEQAVQHLIHIVKQDEVRRRAQGQLSNSEQEAIEAIAKQKRKQANPWAT